MNRRSFIEKTSLTTVSMATVFHVPSFSQSKKLKIGLIGCGWYGMVDVKAALKVGGVEVIGVCDVDSEHLKNSSDELEKLQGNRPKEFSMYQELIDMKDLDAVFICTPPHWHSLQFIAACEKGLDIYCEKPLSYDVNEGIAMMKAAEKTGNIVQIGFQRRQSKAFATAKEYIASGKAGKIHEIGVQIHYNPGIGDTTIQAPPASLDWDSWCGPAPKLDYRPSIGHKEWRLEKEYGNGHLVDWGIHNIDIARHIMGFDMPTGYEANGGIFKLKDKITTPDTLNANMLYNDCTIIWQHRLWGTGSLHPQFNNGVVFYGEKATVFAADQKMVVLPVGKNQKQEELNISSPDMQEEHVGGFLKAVRAKNKNLLQCPIDEAFQSTAMVQLAMISYYTGSKVSWDEPSHKIMNNKDASELLSRAYRGNYQRPN